MTSTDTDRAEAQAWLSGRLHWERILADLQRQAETANAPINFSDSRTRSKPPVPAKAA